MKYSATLFLICLGANTCLASSELESTQVAPYFFQRTPENLELFYRYLQNCLNNPQKDSNLCTVIEQEFESLTSNPSFSDPEKDRQLAALAFKHRHYLATLPLTPQQECEIESERFHRDHPAVLRAIARRLQIDPDFRLKLDEVFADFYTDRYACYGEREKAFLQFLHQNGIEYDDSENPAEKSKSNSATTPDSTNATTTPNAGNSRSHSAAPYTGKSMPNSATSSIWKSSILSISFISLFLLII